MGSSGKFRKVDTIYEAVAPAGEAAHCSYWKAAIKARIFQKS
jgi:hypothetical protein